MFFNLKTPIFKKSLSALLSTLIILTTPDVYAFFSQKVVPATEVQKVAVESSEKAAITFDANNILQRTVEKYKQKMKSGTLTTKRVTTYDPDGNILQQKTKQSFKKSGFFNSGFGKVLGIALVVGAAVVATFAFAAYLNVAVTALTASQAGFAAGIGGGIAQFGVSLAQGQGFKGALLSAGIAFGTAVLGAQLGPMIGGFLKNIPGVGQTLNFIQQRVANFFGSGAATGANAVAGAAARGAATKAASTGFSQTMPQFTQQFTRQFALRAGSEAFSQSFGKKLGVFGTVALLSIGSVFVNAGIAQAQGNAYTANQFADQLVNGVSQGALQGGLAEAFKNQRGVAGQILTQLASNTVGSIDFGGIARNYYNGLILQNRPQGSIATLDSSGRINGFNASVNGIQLNYGSNGSFKNFTAPEGSKITDLSKSTNGQLRGFAIQNGGTLTLVDPARGTAFNAPQPAAVLASFGNSFSKAIQNVGGFASNTLKSMSPYLKPVAQLLNAIQQEINNPYHEPLIRSPDSPFNLFNQPIYPLKYDNPVLDKVNIALAETNNAGIYLLNSLNNVAGYTLYGISKGISAIDQFAEEKVGFSFSDAQIVMTGHPDPFEVGASFAFAGLLKLEKFGSGADSLMLALNGSKTAKIVDRVADTTKSFLPKNIQILAEANLTGSGRTVLGRYPGYINKANAKGASYFDIGDAWDSLTSTQRQAANRHFLDIIADVGDDVFLSVPKGKIVQGTTLNWEVEYLIKQKGYHWVNQWSLKKK